MFFLALISAVALQLAPIQSVPLESHGSLESCKIAKDKYEKQYAEEMKTDPEARFFVCLKAVGDV
jgi:hypothetical protein